MDFVKESKIFCLFSIILFNHLLDTGRLKCKQRVWKTRVMENNHYSLVNVRTDGKTIMCATLDETEDKWVIYTFSARF